MQKFPKISGNQMIRYLQRKGFVIIRRKGSHLSLKNEGVFTTVSAGNKRLGIGIQYSILADVNISREVFIEDYKNGIII
ncbi:MAG: type II toxin-antitoxin system HicA family toxin [Thaumarchaeota archaeon]|nr:type II toxin-antitoxin system HicA family toxin [Nitrososphaerota archaeon]